MTRAPALPAALRQFARDARGTYAVEFAVATPVFLIMVMGALDLGHTLYTRSVLQGTVQKAARDSALETGSLSGNQTAIDAKVTSAVRDLNNSATVTVSRRFYRTFSAARSAQSESYTDNNANGRCDSEPYVDANRNGTYDADGGDGGQGGAKDITVFTVKMSYPRVFPTSTLFGMPANVNLTATTVLANQPYAEQSSYGAALTGTCPA